MDKIEAPVGGGLSDLLGGGIASNSAFEAWRDCRPYGGATEKERLAFLAGFDAAQDEMTALRKAAQDVIDLNRTHARDQYGDADKAESWSCVRVLREALKPQPRAQHPQGTKSQM